MKKIIFLLLCFSLQNTFAESEKTPSATLIPDKKISAMGIEAYKEHIKTITLFEDEDLIANVNCISKHLISHTSTAPDGTEWEFSVANGITPEIIGFAGGKVVMNAGLIGILNDNEMLAAVLANQISPIVLKQANRRFSYIFMATQFEKQSPEEALANLKKHNLAFAIEADNATFDLLVKSGINPNAMYKAFSLLNGLKIGSDKNFDDARIKNIERLLKEKGINSSAPATSKLACPVLKL